MLNDKQLEQIREIGYVVFDGNFDKEKLSQLKRIFEESKNEIQNYSGWAFMGIFRHSKEYLEFIEESGALSVARQLTRSKEVDLYWDSVVIKSAGNQREFCWHQDEGYTETSPKEYYTFWIPFHDVDSRNGGLWVLPESHKEGILEHSRVVASDTKYPGQEIKNLNDLKETPVSLKAGQVLVFSSMLAHRSGANNSNTDRLAMAFAIHKHKFKEINVPDNLAPTEGLRL